jgi:arabinogalactan oligomer/maltooligosaccharide transport system substrate-binding protein
VVAAFNQASAGKGIKATTLAVPFDAFADKITAAVPRGKGPDVFIYAQDRLGGWIEAGNTVEPLDFFLDAPTKGRFLPTTLEAMTYGGSTYGLP